MPCPFVEHDLISTIYTSNFRIHRGTGTKSKRLEWNLSLQNLKG